MNLKIRTFLAIDVDKELIQKIKDLQNEFRKINANIKFVEPENIHFTLKFFGNIEKEMIKKLSIAIEDILNKYDPFEIAIEKMGSFPNENHIKVIWIGIAENKNLIDLKKELDNKFKEFGFKKEKNYTPHLTIARMKNPKNKNEVKKKISEFKDIKIGTIKTNKLYFKKSELTPKGPIYSNIKIFNF